MCQQLGDWFVRIASILIVEELATAYITGGSDEESNATGKALSYVTLARLLPNAVFAQIGNYSSISVFFVSFVFRFNNNNILNPSF